MVVRLILMNNQNETKTDGSTQKKIRVLHIDDEEDFLYLTKEFIEKMSEGEIEVESLKDASKVIERLKSNEIDVVVCDYLMEQLNGLDLLKTIKQEELNIPFIIFTGRGREEVVIDALNLGANYYIRKGSDARSQYTELVHQIRTVHHHKNAEEALKKREQELKEERDLTQLYLNEAGVMFVIINQDEIVELINKEVTNVLGYSEKDLIGKNWFTKVYSSDIVDEIRFNFQQVMVGLEKPTPYSEIDIINKFGERRIIAWHNTAITDESGKIIKLLGIGEDITKRKEIEEAIRESDARYRGFVENFAGIAFQGSIDFRPFFFHGAVEEITGYTEEDFVRGKLTWEDMVLPEDMYKLLSIRDELENTPGFKNDMEYRIRHKEGQIRWIRQHVQNISSKKDEDFVLQGSLIDITEIRRKEEELRKSENLYRTIFESTGLANLIVTEDKTIKMVNSKFVELSGYNREEIEKKRKWTEILIPEDAEKLTKYQELHDQEPGAAPENYEISFKNKSGKVIDAFISVKTITGTSDFIVTLQDITQTKLDEQKLRETANLYKTLFEVTGTFIVIAKKDTTVELINDRLADFSGYSKDEVEGKMSWTQFVAESDLERLKEINRMRFEDPSNVPEQYEAKLTDKKGNIYDCLIHVGLIPETDKYIISMINITKAKQEEREHKKTAEMYKTIFEATGTANIIMGPGRIIKQVNSKVEDMTGYKPVEIIGKNWTDFIPEEEMSSLLKFSRSRTSQPDIVPAYIETKFINKNRDIREIILNLTSVPNSEDYIVSFFDITDMKESEEELKKSEILYRAIFESTGMANVIYDMESTIVLVNSRMANLSGYKKEELEGRKWIEFIPQPELDMMREFMKKRITDPSSVPDQYETKFIDKAGKKIGILIAVTYIPETNNFLAAVADISDKQKEMESLTKQKKELSEFAHLMAHDIRNSLSSIEGYIDLILEDEKDSVEYLSKINKQTEYMRKLLDRSIELADAGQTVEKSDTVNLDELLKSIAIMTIPSDIGFSAETLFSVKADKEKLSQIIKNIFENAVFHGQPRKIEVRKQEKYDSMVLKIINDGKLINKLIIKEAFEESTFSTKGKESIHGLAIVKRLIDAHNWKIKLCEVTEMPCFDIIIPLEDIVSK